MNTLLTSLKISAYRRVFPSFDWDEDVTRVNKIVNPSKIIGKENVGFEKGVPNEEIKSSERAIKNWIDENMMRCSCVIFFVGEKTYKSKWVKYEIQQARSMKKAYFIINLRGVTDLRGYECRYCIDPFRHHGLYDTNNGYVVKQYTWSDPDYGFRNIRNWIEDACQRAGK